MRSRVTPNRLPTSSSVRWWPSISPNRSCSTRRSRGVSVSRTSSTSECSIVSEAAADVLLGDRHDQPEVGLGQALLGLVGALVPLRQPIPGDPVRLERLGANTRPRRAVGGLALALGRRGVEEVLELAEVVEPEQL